MMRRPIGKDLRLRYSESMSDNVIKFNRPRKPEPPRQTPPWMKRALVFLGIALFFLAAFTWFSLTNGSAP